MGEPHFLVTVTRMQINDEAALNLHYYECKLRGRLEK
jgi:hypothetical protein